MFLDSRCSISVADFYCFSQILQYFSELENYSKSEYPNVYRWILQLQEMEGIEEGLKILGFSKMDELPFGLQPEKPKGGPKQKGGKKKGGKQKKQKKKNPKKNPKNKQQKNQKNQEKKEKNKVNVEEEKKSEVIEQKKPEKVEESSKNTPVEVNK